MREGRVPLNFSIIRTKIEMATRLTASRRRARAKSPPRGVLPFGWRLKELEARVAGVVKLLWQRLAFRFRGERNGK
jgi:hypothetical protein